MLQPISKRWALLLAVTVPGCSADGPTDTGTTGAIRVTLAYQGSGDQRTTTVALVGGSQTPTASGNVFLFSSLTPTTYIVEPSDVATGCRVVGATQDTVTVVVGATVDATFAIRCPGSDQLLVMSQAGNYELVNADGTEVREFPGIPVLTAHAWSPDGQRLAFDYAPTPQEPLGVWTINVDGTELATLFPAIDTTPPAEIRWAPDGAHLAIKTLLRRNSSTRAYHMHIVSADGTQDVELPHIFDLSPSYGSIDWSPTGDRLAVAVGLLDSLNNLSTQHIHLFRPDGFDELDLGISASRVLWSPAGGRIAYQDGAELHTIRPDGTDVATVRSTNDPDFDWSPDGSRLVVVAYDGVRVVNSDGTDDHVVYPTPNGDFAWSAAWSPSGNKLAVVTACCPRKVVVMNVDGSDAIDVGGARDVLFAVWRP